MEGTSLNIGIDLLLLSLLAAVIDQDFQPSSVVYLPQTTCDNIIPSLSLTCFCQNSRLCEGEEEVCPSQNDVCFTRMLEDGMYESACYEVESNLFPAVLVNKCLNETHQSISPGELLCCSDRDRCNEDLHPSMQRPSSNDRGPTTFAAPIVSSKADPNDGLYIGLTVAIIIIALVISAVLIIIGVYYYRYLGRRQQTQRRRHIPTVSSSRNLLMRAET